MNKKKRLYTKTKLLSLQVFICFPNFIFAKLISLIKQVTRKQVSAGIFLSVFCVSLFLSLNFIQAKKRSRSISMFGDDLESSPILSKMKNPYTIGSSLLYVHKGLDDAYFKDIQLKYGIRIITELNKVRTIGCAFAKGFRSVRRSDYPVIKKKIREVLDRYPKNFPGSYLKKIVFSNGLTMFGQQVAGFATRETIFLSIKERKNNRLSLQETFHHEFNHILFAASSVRNTNNAWLWANEINFRYAFGGLNAIAKGKSDQKHTNFWLKKGFANEYATASVEEDFATLAAYAINDWEDFKVRALKYPGIAQKFSYLLMFYNSFHKDFNEAFWQNKKNAKELKSKHIFFLDDKKISAKHRRLFYKVSSLLKNIPSFDYQKELKNRKRRERFTSAYPYVLNDTSITVNVKLISPGNSKKNRQAIISPGQEFKFITYNIGNLSNYWAIAATKSSLQIMKNYIKKPKLNLPSPKCFLQDLWKKNYRKHIRDRAGKIKYYIRIIYLSRLIAGSGSKKFSFAAYKKRMNKTKNRNLTWLIINDTLFKLKVKLFSYQSYQSAKSGQATKARTAVYSLFPGQQESTKFYNSLDGIRLID